MIHHTTSSAIEPAIKLKHMPLSNDSSHHSTGATFLSQFPAFDIAHLFNTCSRNNTNIMDKLLRDSSPFLFPCTIEYSLICAAVLYVMWKNIAEEHEHYKSQRRRRKINQKMIQNNVKPYGPNWALDDGKRSGQHYTV